jgi:septal ring factor EnvC (AmiA/AmiB activator)
MEKKKGHGRFLFRFVGIILSLLLVISVTSCATSGVLGFGDPLATASYVDSADEKTTERISSTEGEIAELKAEITALQDELERVSNIKTDIDEMPRQMLRQLVEALESYLEAYEKE